MIKCRKDCCAGNVVYTVGSSKIKNIYWLLVITYRHRRQKLCMCKERYEPYFFLFRHKILFMVIDSKIICQKHPPTHTFAFSLVLFSVTTSPRPSHADSRNTVLLRIDWVCILSFDCCFHFRITHLLKAKHKLYSI